MSNLTVLETLGFIQKGLPVDEVVVAIWLEDDYKDEYGPPTGFQFDGDKHKVELKRFKTGRELVEYLKTNWSPYPDDSLELFGDCVLSDRQRHVFIIFSSNEIRDLAYHHHRA